MPPIPSSRYGQPWPAPRVHPRTRAGAAQAARLAAEKTPLADVPHQKTYLDVLPPELIQLILDYAFPITANNTCSIRGFHYAWPGSYYAYVSEPLLHSILEISSQTPQKSLSELLDKILARPEVRYWCRSLLWVHEGRDGSADDTTAIDSAQEWDYIRSVEKKLRAVEKNGLGWRTAAERHIFQVILKDRLRAKSRIPETTRFALLVSLLPNLERLEIHEPQILHSEWNDDYLATIVNQFRNTLEENRGFATRSQISRSDLDKYYSSLPSEVQLRNNKANKISPLLLNIRSISFGVGYLTNSFGDTFHTNSYIHTTDNIIWAFFLPKITEINIGRLDLQQYHTHQSPLQRLNNLHVSESLIVQRLSLEQLYCSSPVTSLRVFYDYSFYGMECLLRLPKALREFSYCSFAGRNHSPCWPAIWNGLKWHKSSLERLKIGSGYMGRLNDIEQHGTRELRDLLRSLKDFNRLKFLRLRIYQGSVPAICEFATNDRAARCQSTILPRCLKHMIIGTCYTGDPYDFAITLLYMMEVLEMKETALPNLRVLQVDLQLQQGQDTSIKFLTVVKAHILMLQAVAKEKKVDIVLQAQRNLFVAGT